MLLPQLAERADRQAEAANPSLTTKQESIDMSKQQPKVPAEEQRRSLRQSEKEAAKKQPENFKDKETDEKLVEIGPDPTDAPIKGIDPER